MEKMESKYSKALGELPHGRYYLKVVVVVVVRHIGI